MRKLSSCYGLRILLGCVAICTEVILVSVTGRAAEMPQPLISEEAIVADEMRVIDEAVMQELRRCCSCCPQWPSYFVFDALLLQRNNGTNGQPIAVTPDPLNPVPLMTTSDLRFPVAAGTRLLYGHRGNDNIGWEIGYLGVYGMQATTGISGINQQAVPGDLGQVVSGWGRADNITAIYASTLNLAEANVFLFNCCESCDCEAALDCRRTAHCRCTDFLAGFFWAGLDESATLDVTCCVGDPPSPYSVRATSNLFGGLLGVRRRAD